MTARSELQKAAEEWVESFAKALDSKHADAVADLFCEGECFWRDLVAFTWNIKTLQGKDAIKEMISCQSDYVQSDKWRVQPDTVTGSPSLQAPGDTGVGDQIEARVRFETDKMRCDGHLRIVRQGGGFKCWTLMTRACELAVDPAILERPRGGHFGAILGRKTHRETVQRMKASLLENKDPYVVIVGGGQSGIILGARLERLGVRYVIVDGQARVGDMWRKRYDALCLHDPIENCHLPYLPFPDWYPKYLPKDLLADWLENYVNILGLEYWTSSWCRKLDFDSNAEKWRVELDSASQGEIVFNATHVVLATGNYGKPNMPDIEGLSHFSGRVLHSSEYSSGSEFAEKRVVVVGTNTSGHDIAQDLWEQGAQVTMIQRSSTTIVSMEALEQTIFSPFCEKGLAEGITLDDADFNNLTLPIRLIEREMVKAVKEMRRIDAELLTALNDVGFKCDDGQDDTGCYMKFLREGFGYYFDIGASRLVADQKIKLKNGTLRRLEGDKVFVWSGDKETEIEADVVVCATGFVSMAESSEMLLPSSVMDKVKPSWGYGSGQSTRDPGPYLGEIRNQWKPTAQKGLWLMGGNFSYGRIYSLPLALQLRARQDGIEPHVYH